jgi:hypothetical protein
MATVTKVKLSGSTDGMMIKVAATATLGTAIHTANSNTAGEDDFDEIWLWAVNHDTSPRLLTIEYGGATSPDCLIEVTIPVKSGLMLVVPGLILENGLAVTAFAAAANVIMIGGFVNRMTPA